MLTSSSATLDTSVLEPSTFVVTPPAQPAPAPCSTAFTVASGRTHPLGATPDANGVNFALFSENATGVELLLFGEHDCEEPLQVIRLSPETNKTFHIWHVYVKGAAHGLHYAYRVQGPQKIHEGHRFDGEKLLL